MPQDNSGELIERLVEAVKYLHLELHTRHLDEWEGLDMTIPQIKTLVMLGHTGPLRMGSIAVYLGRALSATTTVVDRLVETGPVERISAPDDRRVVICQLSDEGQVAIEVFWQNERERLQLLADILTPEQLQTVVEGVETIRWADEEAMKALAAMRSSD